MNGEGEDKAMLLLVLCCVTLALGLLIFGLVATAMHISSKVRVLFSVVKWHLDGAEVIVPRCIASPSRCSTSLVVKNEAGLGVRKEL